MLVVLSPAKRLDETPPSATGGTDPVFSREAAMLAGYAGALDDKALGRLMHLSPALARVNVARFAAFGSGRGVKQAIELFAGDTYTGLEAASLDPDEMDYAQRHLRILSGLYGLLRPRDRIAPHRLEMGSRLANPRGRNLYAFWGDRIAARLSEEARALGTETLVNCASVEYFAAADRDALGLRIITPTFLEEHANGPRIVAVFAKQARGAMARFILQTRLTDPDGLKDFDRGGYRFQPEMSTSDRPVFLRGTGPASGKTARASVGQAASISDRIAALSNGLVR